MYCWTCGKSDVQKLAEYLLRKTQDAQGQVHFQCCYSPLLPQCAWVAHRRKSNVCATRVFQIRIAPHERVSRAQATMNNWMHPFACVVAPENTSLLHVESGVEMEVKQSLFAFQVMQRHTVLLQTAMSYRLMQLLIPNTPHT